MKNLRDCLRSGGKRLQLLERSKFSDGEDIQYMIPIIAFTEHLTEKIKVAAGAGKAYCHGKAMRNMMKRTRRYYILMIAAMEAWTLS